MTVTIKDKLGNEVNLRLNNGVLSGDTTDASMIVANTILSHTDAVGVFIEVEGEKR